MSIIATIMNTKTGQPVQKMVFGRMPKPWASFNLANGELVTAERVSVAKPPPGKFSATVEIWVSPKDCLTTLCEPPAESRHNDDLH